MLDAEQQKALDDLLARLTDAQRVWLAEYLQATTVSRPQGNTASQALTIYYATETGNTKTVAHSLDRQARQRGFKTTVASLSRVNPADLVAKKAPVILLTSTHGEGDPPEMAQRFFKALMADAAVSFSGLRYAVLGLGDRAYAKFCEAANLIDCTLQERGGQAFHPAALFDVDYAAHLPGWMEQVLGALQENVTPLQSSAVIRPAAHSVSTKGFSRLEPVAAEIKDILKLSDRGSRKETYHIELAFAQPLPYSAGDSVGILLPPELDDKQPPRLYSIASSPLAYENEIHLTVALARHTQDDGMPGFGRCSRYLTQLQSGDAVQCFIQRNQRFRLPDDDAQDIIMIGPGTGIAPFRAFLQERAQRGAAGRNWLFFGDQQAHCDFLYQAEWQDYLENGTLTHMNVAFSRDQENKIYVQHHLQERAAEVLAWLDGGARVYVCGAKSPMSEDVEAMLLSLVQARLGERSRAQDYIAQLAEDDRYLKDVY